MADLKQITERLIQFRKDRDWEQFHNPKDVAISLSLEASEVLECFQWKSEKEISDFISNNKEELGEELADVFNWVLLLSHDAGIDILEMASKKIDKNAKKYPVNKARGTHKKYTQL